VLVRAPFVALLLAAVAPARAAPIQDNSFLIEEAYNQEPGVIQHVGTFHRTAPGEWEATFTEEWPAGGQTHQLSATFALARTGGEVGAGDLALNYRWQALGDGEAPVAVSPRFSALLPTGAGARGFGSGGLGAQVQLPVSAMLGARFVAHTNLGAAWIPSATTPEGRGKRYALQLGEGLVWLLHDRLNLLVETVYELGEVALDRGGTASTESLLVSPGVRGGIDVGSLQIVAGLAAPLGVGPSSGEHGLFLYLSFEHPISGR
jgi:hypothetical protein